jgi:hypothetical protein
VLPDALTLPAAVLVLAGVAAYALRTADPDRPWRGALLMTGAAFIVTAPSYPWYGLMIVALVALDGRVEWLAVAIAGEVTNSGPGLHLNYLTAQQISYGGALLVVLTTALLRRRQAAAQREAMPVPARVKETSLQA